MKIWKYPSSAALLINCYWSALDHGLSLNNIASNMIWRFVHRFILKKVFLCHCQMLNITFRDFDDSSSDSFFAPKLIRMLFVFLPKGPLYCPRWSTFQGVSRKCWCHFYQGFCKLNWCSCLKIFLVLESNLTFQRSCLFKSNCWNEIREMFVFLKLFFLLKFKLLWSKTQHTIQCSPLIVLYLENRNDPL